MKHKVSVDVSMSIVILFVALFFGCKKEKRGDTVTLSNKIEKKETLFELVHPDSSGIKFKNHVEENLKNYVVHFNYVYNGGGVAIGDINNDGLSDIYFSSNEESNKLYLNKGNFKFEDITESAGVGGGEGWHTGINMIDINHDGFLDIYICRGGFEDTDTERKNLLYINDGNMKFSEQAEKYGLADKGFSVQAVFFDMDNDNDLDMYLTNRPELFFQTVEELNKGERENNDLYRDKLFLNENNTFREIGLKAGIVNNYGYGLGVSTLDANNDGLTDIYVTNDYEQSDYLYINQGNNKFKESIKKFTNHTSFYSMGIDVVDFNNDGFEDILALDMVSENYVRSKTTMASMNLEKYREIIDRGYHSQYMHNMLHLNEGNGFYSEIGQLAGIAKTDWSWSCLGSDFDNDGYRDIFISNGYRRDVTDKDATKRFFNYINSNAVRQNSDEQNLKNILDLYPTTKLSNYIFSNNADLTFDKKMVDWGLEQKSFSNGAATADLDNDGDLDLVINNLEDIAFVYENKLDEQTNKNYLKIKLNGPKKNPQGIGAKVELMYGDQVQYHDFKVTRGYLSSVEPVVHFGLGEVAIIDQIRVVWPDKKVNTLTNVESNKEIEVRYREAATEEPSKKIEQTLFVETTADIRSNFRHKENTFDDYENQILLPHQMSRLGPFVSVADIDGDGLEDFYVGGAMGQSGAVYIQDNKGKFKALPNQTFVSDRQYEDMGATFFDVDNDGDVDLYVVSGGSENEINSKNYQDRLYVNNGKGKFVRSENLPEITESGSCVVTYDFDSDGDLDLFVGGRQTPGKYPLSANSHWLRNDGGVLVDITESNAPELLGVGMVTSAVWANIDNDSTKELIVVGEWMPITIFKIVEDKLKNITEQFNLGKTSGWWNKVIAKDYDKDGDQDLIFGNLGENYKFTASDEKPFYVFANDFDSNGTNDIFLAKKLKNNLVPIRGKECSSQQIPSLSKKFKTYEGFAKADLPTILGDKIMDATRYEAHIFSSIILENTGQGFKMHKLPVEAQFSTVNGIVCDDFDDDGIQDILLGGNKFEVEIETTRADASPGFVFMGSSPKSFQAVKPAQSGFFIPYNVKDIQQVKIANGKKGILVTTNDNILRLFKTTL
ncbi:VCBS repeat-containing protein [Zobellia galactanivorans]|uniref:Similar to ASPIC and UnbV protein containing FG-GAP repeats n=1 Tax=Zobellia galactanivorans (strain DSM 12802 / CCUG 47099 / CIP 106680 / NCIMB 13871 / Dsij) TaxID=63186 RepID=G0L4Q1_ZOBGA|nr:VCBS repeat-containing protein [Zobellia galactanivorans]CAZ98832.1 Similar to ASPIC and UnbV protein containing FG-GAP repeats [Zobellia galactanivorans]